MPCIWHQIPRILAIYIYMPSTLYTYLAHFMQANNGLGTLNTACLEIQAEYDTPDYACSMYACVLILQTSC